MIIYEITAEVRIDLIKEYEKFMLDTHINDVLKTGYFDSAEMVQVTDGVYRMQYYLKDRDTLQKYFDTDVTRLREDFANHFPKGVIISRDILEILFMSKDSK